MLSYGVLSCEQHQALRMVLDDLKELFLAKELTYEQYRVQLAAAHDRALADEFSLSPDLVAAGAVAGHPWSASVEQESAKQERCDRQVESEKKVVPGVRRCKCHSGKDEKR